MSLKLFDSVLGFTQNSTEGRLHFHEYAGGSLTKQKPYLRLVT